jgi:hypothetical protein
MRPSPFIIIALILLLPILWASPATAQVTPHYIALYAHSFSGSTILTALPQWGGQKSADISRGITFRLSPALGNDLQIDGAITTTLYLRTTGTFVGTVGIQVVELSKDGVQRPVPGARVDSPFVTSPLTVQVILGVGIIDYAFHMGSAILLRTVANQTAGTGAPILLWDDQKTPTNVRNPVTSTAAARMAFTAQPGFGRIIEANNKGFQTVRIDVSVTDAIGVYRFIAASLRLLAPNGTSIDSSLNPNNVTDYISVFSVV